MRDIYVQLQHTNYHQAESSHINDPKDVALKEKVKIKVLDWSLCVGRPPDLLCSLDQIINVGFELFIFLFNRKVQVRTLIREP